MTTHREEPFDPLGDQRFILHRSECQMILQRAKITPIPSDPLYGYRQLADYVMDAFNATPFTGDDAYLRVLAACKAEMSTPLPTITHMQRIMSLLWDREFPEGTKETFERICASISTGLCHEITNFATVSMKAVAASLHVSLAVEWDSNTQIEMTGQEPVEPAPSSRSKKGDKPLLH